MTIEREDLKMFKSTAVNDTSSNGGRMSANEVASGAIGNLFAPIDRTERLAGSLKYRKAFLKVNEDGSGTLFNGQVLLDTPTPGDDIITLFPGTQTDTQASITGSERRYGAGNLDDSISGGASTFDVEVEEGNTGIFQENDTIRVTDKASLDGAGNEEFRVIDYVTWLGNVATIFVTEALDNAYSDSDTRVSSVYEPGDVVATVSNFVVTTAGSGDYDDDDLTLNNRGTIEQTWTLTWTGATNFNIVGDTVGSAGSGTNGAGASPNNPSFTKPYFILAAGGFSGTWANGDTLVFQTHPIAVPVWFRRDVPAASAALGNNTAKAQLWGERV